MGKIQWKMSKPLPLRPWGQHKHLAEARQTADPQKCEQMQGCCLGGVAVWQWGPLQLPLVLEHFLSLICGPMRPAARRGPWSPVGPWPQLCALLCTSHLFVLWRDAHVWFCWRPSFGVLCLCLSIAAVHLDRRKAVMSEFTVPFPPEACVLSILWENWLLKFCFLR